MSSDETEAERIVRRFDGFTQEQHEAGIAAARERHPQFSAFLRRALSNPETKAAYDAAAARDAEVLDALADPADPA